MRMLQFELWKDCSNNCSFCWNRDLIHSITPQDIKIENINYVISRLDGDISGYDVVSIIGGEFFEGQLKDLEVKKAFTDLIYKFVSLLKGNKVEQVFIMLSFMRSVLPDLDEVISIFDSEGVLNKVLWCTSYDETGRFHTKEQKQIWINNIEKYSKNIRIHTEMIMTEPMINAIIDGNVSLKWFFDRGVSVDFIRPRVHINKDRSDKTKQETLGIVPFIYPKRNTFLKFLSYLQKEYPQKLEDLYSMEIRAFDVELVSEKRVMHRDIEHYLEDKEKDKILPCGHSDKFAGYIDSDNCMVCDIEKYKKELM